MTKLQERKFYVRQGYRDGRDGNPIAYPENETYSKAYAWGAEDQARRPKIEQRK